MGGGAAGGGSVGRGHSGGAVGEEGLRGLGMGRGALGVEAGGGCELVKDTTSNGVVGDLCVAMLGAGWPTLADASGSCEAGMGISRAGLGGALAEA